MQKKMVTQALSLSLFFSPGFCFGSTVPGDERSNAQAFFFDDIPEVLSVTKLKQSKADTPATVTVIEGDLIKSLGINNLWEVFRLVPGMTLGFVESNVPVVSYHGTVANDQRRLQILIDGRSTFRAGLADIDWHFMPVALDNIQKIEITRGPNAAVYGQNSFLAIINIITKKPSDSDSIRIRSTNGSSGLAHHYVSVATQTENSQWRLSGLNRRHSGFDNRYYNPPDGTDSDLLLDFNDSYDVAVMNLDGTYRISPNQTLDLFFGLSHGEDEVDPQEYGPEYGISTEPNTEGNDYFGQVRWNYHFSDNHFIHIQTYYQKTQRDQSWTSMLDLEALGLSPVPAVMTLDANQDVDETRFDIEFQDTFVINDRFRTVSGLSYREDKYETETYLNGKGSNYLFRVFANAEYSPVSLATLNAGAMFEDDTDNGEYISPRIALNIHLTDYQTLRFILSKAYRTPDTFEQSADWGYTARNVSPDAFLSFEGQRLPGIGTVATGGLEAEKIISREISYFGQFRTSLGLWMMEVKYFHDSLYDIISGRLSIGNWDIENNVSLTQQGAELEASLDFGNTFARLTYAYIDQDGRYTGSNIDPMLQPSRANRFIEFESRLTSQHSGSFALVQRFRSNYQAAVAYYIADSLNHWDFQRVDFRIAKQFEIGSTRLNTAFLMQHYLNDDPVLHRDNIIADRNQYAIEVSMAY